MDLADSGPPPMKPIIREFSRIKRLPPYVFNITAELKMAARRRGEDIIDMSMGNPDGPTPAQTSEYFGVNTFGARQMRDKLPKKVYQKLVAAIRLAATLARHRSAAR